MAISSFRFITVFLLIWSVGCDSHARDLKRPPSIQAEQQSSGATSTSSSSSNAATSTDSSKKSEKKLTNIRWYGHSFIYITSPTGVRIAMDPFGEQTVKYSFPERLVADVVLISNEGESYGSAERIWGQTLVFRSLAALGVNKGPGFLFRGIQTYKDNQRGARLGSNMVFSFTIDEVRYAHMGVVGHPLDSRQRQDIGPVDVLFLPVGLKEMPVDEYKRMAEELNAKVIVPITYQTSQTGVLDLRPLDDFINGMSRVITVEGAQMDLSPEKLPAQPTVYVMKLP